MKTRDNLGRFKKNRVIVKCFVCGNKIEKRECNLKKFNYCSRKCSDKSNIHKYRPPKTGKDVECVSCKKIFYRVKSHLKEVNYCSKSCAAIGGNRVISLIPEWGNPKPGNIKKNKSIEHRNKVRIAALKRWQNPEFRKKHIPKLVKRNKEDLIKPEIRKKVLKSLGQFPSSFEKVIMELIDIHKLPYKYTGDGEFFIGNKNPDFLNTNGENTVIEVYNNYHHPNDYEEVRGKLFTSYGFKTIFINESDIKHKNRDNIILEKINGV